MPVTSAVRRRAARSLLVTALLAISVGPPAHARSDSADGSQRARAATAASIGETWYGQVEWSGTGSVRVSDGVYVNHDRYTARAPRTSDSVTLTSTVDSKITRPDPDPASPGCWTKKETWVGSGTSTGYFKVIEEGSRYWIQLFATEPITVTFTIEYGGTIGLEPCSKGNITGTGNFTPWVNIYSSQNHRDAYRSGSMSTPSLEDYGACGASPFAECTEPLSFLHRPPSSSRWSLSKNACSGYSRSYRLGNGDTAFVFTQCQTKSLSARTSWLQEASGAPRVCKYAFVKKLSRACTGYKAVTQTQWAQNDWFMWSAGNAGRCGIWVVDKASWRPPKIRPAMGTDNVAVAWVSPGKTVAIRTAKGSVPVTC